MSALLSKKTCKISKQKNTPSILTMTSAACSPRVFRLIGEDIVGRSGHGNSRCYVAFFGLSPLRVAQLWSLIIETRSAKSFAPKHLLWGLLLLRSYNREEVLAALVGVMEKTFRKWAWMVIEEISKIDNLVSDVMSANVNIQSTSCCYSRNYF